jgi:hypothetical protein
VVGAAAAAVDAGADRHFASPAWKGSSMSVAGGKKIVDISLELGPKNFGMRTPAGFSKDLQITSERFTLIALPLNIVGAEASPVRAVVLM